MGKAPHDGRTARSDVAEGALGCSVGREEKRAAWQRERERKALRAADFSPSLDARVEADGAPARGEELDLGRLGGVRGRQQDVKQEEAIHVGRVCAGEA